MCAITNNLTLGYHISGSIYVQCWCHAFSFQTEKFTCWWRLKFHRTPPVFCIISICLCSSLLPFFKPDQFLNIKILFRRGDYMIHIEEYHGGSNNANAILIVVYIYPWYHSISIVHDLCSQVEESKNLCLTQGLCLESLPWNLTCFRFPELRHFFFDCFLPEAVERERQRRQRIAKQRHKNNRRSRQKKRWKKNNWKREMLFFVLVFWEMMLDLRIFLCGEGTWLSKEF